MNKRERILLLLLSGLAVVYLTITLAGSGLWAVPPDKSQEDAIREAVFRFQIDSEMAAYRMSWRSMSGSLPLRRVRPPLPTPVFVLETTAIFNGNSEGLVTDAMLRHLQGHGYLVKRGMGGKGEGNHLHAASIHWKTKNKVAVDGGTMGFEGPARFRRGVGRGTAYQVECKNGRWSVTKEQMTTIT